MCQSAAMVGANGHLIRIGSDVSAADRSRMALAMELGAAQERL